MCFYTFFFAIAFFNGFFIGLAKNRKVPNYLLELHAKFYVDVLVYNRDGGGLFNLARLRSEKHTRKNCIRELLYADDSALVSNNLEEVQEITNRFADAAKLFGLKINVSKTEFLFQPAPDTTYPTHPTITVD